MFEGEEFFRFQDRDSGALFADLEFRKCLFRSCSVGLTRTFDPKKRTTIQNVRLLDCEAAGCFIGPAILQDVVVDGLKTPKVVIADGCVFKHTVIMGRVDRVIIGPIIPPVGIYEENRAKIAGWFEKANAEYYKTVDWALDISEGEFSDFDIRGIPSRLIRRDPFTQAVVKRKKVLDGKWRKLDLSGTWWPVSLEMLGKSNWEDEVLIAPKRHRQFSQALKGIYILRDAGIAEPD